ncbi:hypothetical protein IHE45_07G000600 [Dioscorea alata]|uniref:Uncharacterized protein n=1 Tax=Dioscorea alata TaxID=55571 RepID=A0ACB7VP94_DIOAL|nr:hypothetical protein IHE45_07G000600 [Dioscorea alata]
MDLKTVEGPAEGPATSQSEPYEAAPQFVHRSEAIASYKAPDPDQCKAKLVAAAPLAREVVAPQEHPSFLHPLVLIPKPYCHYRPQRLLLINSQLYHHKIIHTLIETGN